MKLEYKFPLDLIISPFSPPGTLNMKEEERAKVAQR